jgi:hypothetical protein
MRNDYLTYYLQFVRIVSLSFILSSPKMLNPPVYNNSASNQVRLLYLFYLTSLRLTFIRCQRITDVFEFRKVKEILVLFCKSRPSAPSNSLFFCRCKFFEALRFRFFFFCHTLSSLAWRYWIFKLIRWGSYRLPLIIHYF